MFIWLAILVDMASKEVVGTVYLTAENPQSAADKSAHFFKEVGTIQEDRQYHAHIMALGKLPGIEPAVVIPNTQQVVQIARH